jgi:hypothetical protein
MIVRFHPDANDFLRSCHGWISSIAASACYQTAVPRTPLPDT